MKHGKRLTRSQKKLLRANKYNDDFYLLEREIPEGIMFVDRPKTHRLFYDKATKGFSKFNV